MTGASRAQPGDRLDRSRRRHELAKSIRGRSRGLRLEESVRERERERDWTRGCEGVLLVIVNLVYINGFVF